MSVAIQNLKQRKKQNTSLFNTFFITWGIFFPKTRGLHFLLLLTPQSKSIHWVLLLHVGSRWVLRSKFLGKAMSMLFENNSSLSILLLDAPDRDPALLLLPHINAVDFRRRRAAIPPRPARPRSAAAVCRACTRTTFHAKSSQGASMLDDEIQMCTC